MPCPFPVRLFLAPCGRSRPLCVPLGLLHAPHSIIHPLFDSPSLISGTTRRGIGPTYSSKATRDGLRMCDIAGDWSDFVTKYDKLVDSRLAMYGIDPSTYDKKTELDKLKEKREKMIPWITDTVCLLNGLLHQGKSVLAEGANACLLDIDFGTYPYVTSSSTTVGGVGTGLGTSDPLPLIDPIRSLFIISSSSSSSSSSCYTRFQCHANSTPFFLCALDLLLVFLPFFPLSRRFPH